MKNFAFIIAILIMGLGTSTSLHFIEKSQPENWQSQKLTYLPSGKMLKPVLLDHENFFASLLWVKGIIYFAEEFLSGSGYKWLGHILKIVTDLNPKFEAAYEFGGLMLAKNPEQLEQSVKLLEKGFEQFPDKWQLRVFAAMNQIKLDSNYEAAANILKPLANRTDVPDYVKTLPATFMQKGGSKKMAVYFLMEKYLQSTSNSYRQLIRSKLENLAETQLSKDEKKDLELVLTQASQEPRFSNMGKKILMEILTDKVSPQSEKVLGILRRAAQ